MDQLSELKNEIEKLKDQLDSHRRVGVSLDPAILETVISNIGIGFVVSDVKGNIIYENDAALRIHDFRYENEELSTIDQFRKVFELEYPEGGTVPFDKWPLSLAIRGDYFRDYQLKLINPGSRSRKIRFISYNAIPIYDKNGTKKYIVVTLTDLSEIRERTQELHESRLRYQSLFNNNTLAMAHCRIITDDDGIPVDYEIIHVNDAYTRISGLKKKEVEGKRATLVFPGIRNFSFDFISRYGKIALDGGEFNEEIFDERFRKHISLYAYSPIKGEFTLIFNDISLRKEMEDKLAGERELFESIFDNIPVMITIYDPGMMTFRLNREVKQLLQWNEEDAADGKYMEKVYPDPEYRKEAIEFMQSLTGDWKELRPVAKDGTTVLSSWANVKISSGIQIGIGIDIRKRKQDEEALRRSEQRLRSIFGNAAIGIVEVDSEDRIISVNERACDILGYNSNELTGRTIHEITVPEDRMLSLETNSKIHKGEVGIIDYEKRYLKKDGSRIWVHVTISGVYDSSGKHVHSVGTIEDITERRHSQEALKRSESTLKQAGIMANLGAWEFEIFQPDDINKNRLHWSDQVYRIFGYEPGTVEVTNDLFFERVHPDDRAKVQAAVDAAIQNMHSYTVEHRIIRQDGVIRFVIENAEIITDNSGKTLRMIGAVQDITERKLAEESLRKKNEELTRFIYTVSHDLKSPLVTIKSFSNYLQEDIKNNDKDSQDRDLKFIRNAADKMARLLDELLELSRIGRKEKPKSFIPLSEVVKAASDLVAGRLEEKKIKVSVSGLPVMLYGHTQRFIQLFQNLIDNSAKFMGDQPQPSVETGAFTGENNDIVIFVRDNGKGIDPRYHHKIFGLFEKMDVETEGTGIGLALVKRIVEVHGGSIWFTSEGEGTGTTFYFTLEGTIIIK
ncbi:MAG TPA: PAS domain S-box protein [Bacteroidales bacterium]|nr:PAS domain S-box protein [Bacteroidales bacterium]